CQAFYLAIQAIRAQIDFRLHCFEAVIDPIKPISDLFVRAFEARQARLYRLGAHRCSIASSYHDEGARRLGVTPARTAGKTKVWKTNETARRPNAMTTTVTT